MSFPGEAPLPSQRVGGLGTLPGNGASDCHLAPAKEVEEERGDGEEEEEEDEDDLRMRDGEEDSTTKLWRK